MTTVTPKFQYRPAAWLRELARLQPSRWPVGRSIRAAVCVGAPLAIGLATDHVLWTLWFALAGMIFTVGEGDGSWPSRFRQVAIVASVGVTGFFAGYLSFLPWPAVVVVMAALAFLSAIVSSYGAPFSSGAMQALIFATLSLGLPQTGPHWQSACFYLAGVAVYAAAMGIEALIDRGSPRRVMLASYIAALARLAEMHASQPMGLGETGEMEAARRAVTDQSKTLYASLLETRSSGRTHEVITHAGILDAADNLFSAIVAENAPHALQGLAVWLLALGAAVQQGAGAPEAPTLPQSPSLASGAARFAAAIADGGFVQSSPAMAPPATPPPDMAPGVTSTGTESTGAASKTMAAMELAPVRVRLLRHLAIGPEVRANAARLALCMGLAFAIRSLVHDNHWYWIPLTVAIIMKPDFGSVFTRAVLRAAGTSVGVVIGVIVLTLLPKGFLLVAAVAVLAALMPWAKGVSYAMQTLALTPLVLIILDLMAPAQQTIDYGAQRFFDTLIAGAIVLVFGYFIWPRSPGQKIAVDFSAAMAALADYLTAAGGTANAAASAAAARLCYVRLSDLRAELARLVAEPPPAGREAAAWFPAIAGAERICDHITVWAAQRQPDEPAEVSREVARDAAIVAAHLMAVAVPDGYAGPPATIATPALAQIMDEADRIGQRLEIAAAPA